MNPFKKSLLSLAAAFFFAFSFAGIPAVAAEKGKVRYQLSMTPMAKASRNSIQRCNAVYVEDVTVEGEELAVLAAPGFCRDVWFNAPVAEFRDQKAVHGVTFYFFVKDPAFVPADISFSRAGDEVKVVDDEPVAFSVGNWSIRAFAVDTSFLFASVTQLAEGGARNQSCTSAGCTVFENTPWFNLLILDRALPSVPGTAVVGLDNQLVGMVLGTDNGRTLVMSAIQLSGWLCELRDPGACKG